MENKMPIEICQTCINHKGMQGIFVLCQRPDHTACLNARDGYLEYCPDEQIILKQISRYVHEQKHGHG